MAVSSAEGVLEYEVDSLDSGVVTAGVDRAGTELAGTVASVEVSGFEPVSSLVLDFSDANSVVVTGVDLLTIFQIQSFS